MPLKVVIIGGGSSYTPEIIEGFILRHHSFPVDEVVLVDIEDGKEKLETVGKLAQRMIDKSNVKIALRWTLDRREALRGADFVSTQIRVGGLAARALDERIPLKHGFIGQETNGAGGMFKAFRTIPVLLELADEMAELCPDAWLINFTNPAGIVTEALLKHSKHQKVIGVCNIPFNMRNSVAEILHAPVEHVSIEFIGLNHFIFGRQVTVNGVDRTEDVLSALSQGNDYSPANIVGLGWSESFLNSIKMLPNPYHQYYFQTRDVLAKDRQAYEENGTRAEVVQEVERRLFEQYRDVSLDVKPKELEQRGGAYYSDAACNLMDSLYNDRGDIQTVNTLNQGTIRDLPEDVVIEVNAVITKAGPRPLSIGSLPFPVRGLITNLKTFEELTIQAAVSGNYEGAYLAALMNPLIQDEKRIDSLLEELFRAHQAYLPQFQLKEVLS
ncbi:6-phospho-beta-glucosidase [Exiguobacterium acetylicum]|uniref:6-phospho-beta-glucosidase n=1 Tax=Exiguobacterium acetylicum TaxID=41170 RepID=UPI001CA627FE|nr:6-phospho-beta-glucosidase [Exiguobacterium acetylicum]QZY88189.1 6-phospho-beta-glucosidase [Exiguobacterium acetylicum]